MPPSAPLIAGWAAGWRGDGEGARCCLRVPDPFLVVLLSPTEPLIVGDKSLCASAEVQEGGKKEQSLRN